MRPIANASVLILAALSASLMAPAHASAADELSNGTVTPTEGITATTFVFSVDYSGNPGDIPAVSARVGDLVVRMEIQSGLPQSGTYVGSSTLPAGTWQVIFHAENLQGASPDLAGPTVTVRDDRPTPPPTARPTPVPTATPRPTPALTPAPTARPSPSPTPTPRETPGGGVYSPTPMSTPTGEPSKSASPDADRQPPASGSRLGFGSLAMLFVGGTMAGSGAAILGVHSVRRRGSKAANPRPVETR